MRLELGPSLADIKAKAAREIDAQAEKARLAYLTAGAGQMLEYAATETEARTWLQVSAAGGSPVLDDYPFLKAEHAALVATGGTVEDLAQKVLNQAMSWTSVGAEIKRIRREAKLRVEAAGTVEQVRAITAALAWP